MTEPRKRKSPAKDTPPVRRGRTRSVAEILPEISGTAFRKFGFIQSSVISRWSEIVGPQLANVSAPEAIRFPKGEKTEGTLQLSVQSAHAPMLQHIAPDIIERVNRFFGYAAVSKVTMRQGAMIRRKRVPIAPEAPQPLPQDMGDSLRAIQDDELKTILSKLAGSIAKNEQPTEISIAVIGKIR